MAATLASSAYQRVAGDVIARKYRLERQLGEGSQGAVWQAQNLALDLPVALKLVHHFGEGGGVPQRLFREARSAAMLGHPAIVRVFDFGETADGLPFLAMELLTGESLADYLERVETIRPEFALRLLLPIADALAAAHARGIVHRDVKPDNIFLSSSGQLMQPKLLDFGIATLAEGEGSALPRLTRTGAVLGTPNYLPPEQARGLQEVDPRADIWSLCATLYECVTGVTPFHATSWIDVLKRILEEDPEPIARYGIEDAKLWQLLRQGLAKAPEDRWPDARAFGRASASWLLERGVSCDICGVSVEARWLLPEIHDWKLGRLGAEETGQSRPATAHQGSSVDSAKPIPLTRAVNPSGHKSPTVSRQDAPCLRASTGAASLDRGPSRVSERLSAIDKRLLGGFSAVALFAGSAIGINQLDTSFESEAGVGSVSQPQEGRALSSVDQQRRFMLEPEGQVPPAPTSEGVTATTTEGAEEAAESTSSLSPAAKRDGPRSQAAESTSLLSPAAKHDGPRSQAATSARADDHSPPSPRSRASGTPAQPSSSGPERKSSVKTAPRANRRPEPPPRPKPAPTPSSAGKGLDLMEPY